MEQHTTANIRHKDDKKIESIFWSIFFGSLFLFALVVCIGLYLLANDFSVLVSYLICLGIAAMGSFIVYGPLRRYLKIPIWRWSVSRCIADKRTKTQKLCMWLGRACSLVGGIIIANHVVWRWIFRIRDDRLLGSIPEKIAWVGAVIFLIGLCILQISKPTDK